MTTPTPTIDVTLNFRSVAIAQHVRMTFSPGLEVEDKDGLRLLIMEAGMAFRWHPAKGEWQVPDKAHIKRKQLKKDGSWGVVVGRDLYSFSDRAVMDALNEATKHLMPTEPPTVYEEK